LTRLLIPKLSEVEKKVHGTSAEYEKIGYGMPPVSTRTSREKTRVKMIVSARGCRTAQAMPSSDCL